MNLNKVIVITFVTSILIISSSQISFAKKNVKEEDGKDLKKDIRISSIDKTKKSNRDSKETDVQNDILKVAKKLAKTIDKGIQDLAK